ncbi:MAG: type I restriction endonuclease [Candidatus Acidiferrum sp.]|jgi:hypothetical protein
MDGDLSEFIGTVKAERKYVGFDEAATKQGIILPLLAKLGWNCFNVDEVYPEYGVEERRVDFALRIGANNKVFIEAKRPAEDLEKHQRQLLQYSFAEGVKLAVLTNGRTWWFYLPLNEGGWEERRFYAVDMEVQPCDQIAAKFTDYLSKVKVSSGEAVRNAEKARDSLNKEKKLRETLPRALEKILSDADDEITDLLAGTTEQLCGFRPDADRVALFLKDYRGSVHPASVSPFPAATARIPDQAPRGATLEELDYSGRSVEGFEFLGKQQKIDSWIDLLLDLCQLMKTAPGQNFEKCLALVGRKRPYFAKNSDLLRRPKMINGTDIYVETNLSANSIVGLSRNLIALFGYKENDLKITVG